MQLNKTKFQKRKIWLLQTWGIFSAETSPNCSHHMCRTLRHKTLGKIKSQWPTQIVKKKKSHFVFFYSLPDLIPNISCNWHAHIMLGWDPICDFSLKCKNDENIAFILTTRGLKNEDRIKKRKIPWGIQHSFETLSWNFVANWECFTCSIGTTIDAAKLLKKYYDIIVKCLC